MSVFALWMVKSSRLAALPLAGGLLVGVSVAAVLVAIRAAVEEKHSIQVVTLGVSTRSHLVTWAWLASLFFHWFLLACLVWLFVWNPEELGLYGLILGQEKLGHPDQVPIHCILPLQLFMLHHEQDLLVGRAN